MVDHAKHQNWVKSSLSLRLVKDGLVEFSHEKADHLKDSIQKDVEIKCKAAAHTACTKCTFKSIKRDKKGQYYMSCPNCNHWISIIQNHAKPNHKLEWSNSDPKKWYTKSWEIMKVFMGYGCNDSRSAEDIDCSNLMTMMLGCKYFHQFFSTTTILQEIKDIRNSVMHSGTLELTDDVMENHLDKMIDILEDATYLEKVHTCKEAVEKIKQLRDDTMSKRDEYDELARLTSELQNEVKDLKKREDLITSDVSQLSDKQDIFLEMHQKLDKVLHDDMAAIIKKQTLCGNLLDSIKTLEFPDIDVRLQTIVNNLKALKDDTGHNLRRLQDKFEAMDLMQRQLQQRQYLNEQQIGCLGQKQIQFEQKQNLNIQQIGCMGLKQIQLEQKQNLNEQQIGCMGLKQIQLEQKQNLNEQQIGCFGQKQIQLEQKQNLNEQQIGCMDLKQIQMEQRQGKTEAEVQTLRQTLIVKETPDTYEEKKLKLQRHLIELYQSDHSSIPVYPLRPNLTKELDTMFVKQEMIEKNPRGPKHPHPDINDKHDEKEMKIKTLNDLFWKGGKLCKNIYVTGEAGVGKSTFCKYIVNMWLKSKTDTCIKKKSSSDDETMKQFPLLFYVQLRGVTLGTETDTFASLIKTQLNIDTDLEDYFREENCLIIGDSLDEIASGVPFRGILNKSTKLITSRPWKLETLREEIEGKAIDRQIEIVCISEDSAETLVENIIPLLAQESASDSNKNYHSFFKEMKHKGLISFLRIPVLLVQILCLWYEDNIEVGESQSSIYKKLVHYQIMTFVKKSKIYAQLSSDNYTLLECKSKTCPCTNFNDILLKVGKLAFNALVSKNRQNELVFDHSTTKFHGLCEDEVENCLKIGILSQHKLFGKLTEEPKKFMSFVHKTNQEFFASLYLSHKEPISDIKSVLNIAIGNLDRMLQLEKLLMFVSGLNPEMGRTMADLLLKAADQDPRIQDYRQTAEWRGSRHDELVSNIQTAIFTASAECELHQHQQQFRLDDVIVDKANMSRVLSCLPAGSLVTSISMRGDYFSYLPTDGVMSRINTSRLQGVHLYCCTISGDSLSQVVPSSLCVLYLDEVRMSHAALKSLGSRLTAAVKLRQVVLEELQCETHGKLDKGCAPLSLDFSSHVGLEELFIWSCEISSCRMAPDMGKLEIVKLWLVTTTAAMLKQLVVSLPGNNVKVELDEVTIRHEAGAASPAAILHDIRQSCRFEKDIVESEDEDDSDSGDVERRENGDLFVNKFVFYK